ncbi:MAG: RNA polymerase subunit AC19 [Marteilia pararefringens]
MPAETASENDLKDYQLEGESHTLANALRQVINKNDEQIIFCGYSNPHPSKVMVNFRYFSSISLKLPGSLRLSL